MPGPAPTPTKILEARGSWRANVNKNEPMPDLGIPRRPAWLSGKAKTAWDKISRILDDCGVLTIVDENVLARYVTLWSNWRDVQRRLSKLDAATAEVGEFAKWQRLNITMSTELGRLEGKLGLSPSDRTRLSVENIAQDATEGTQDDTEDYLGAGAKKRGPAAS